jgi:hypothetical protein
MDREEQIKLIEYSVTYMLIDSSYAYRYILKVIYKGINVQINEVLPYYKHLSSEEVIEKYKKDIIDYANTKAN